MNENLPTEQQLERIQHAKVMSRLSGQDEYKKYLEEIWGRIGSEIGAVTSARTGESALKSAGRLEALLEVADLVSAQEFDGDLISAEVRARYEASAAAERRAVRDARVRFYRTSGAAQPTE